MALLNTRCHDSYEAGYIGALVCALAAVYADQLPDTLEITCEHTHGFGVLLYDSETGTFYDLAFGADSTDFTYICAHLDEYLKGYAELSQVDTFRILHHFDA